jgi:diacylglycerol kinase
MKLSFKKLFESIFNAFQGIEYAFSQQNFFLMFFIAIGTLILGFWLQISYFEWLMIIFLIGFILSLEMLNTVLEKTLDFLEPYISDKIRMIKDLIAGAVLIACLTAITLGFIIFLPKILIKIYAILF